jgi:hypothetical protein
MIKQLESCDRISLGVRISPAFFYALPCDGTIGQVSATTSPTECAKICLKLGIILDVHENITHYELHTSLVPFLTSSLPAPSTFAQCYALPTSTTHPLLHRTAAQLGKQPYAKTRIQNIYENEQHSGSTDVTYTLATKAHGDLSRCRW